MKEWSAKDPITRLKKTLEEMGGWSDEFGTTTEHEATHEVQEAAAQSLTEPMPAVETMFEDVYDREPWTLREQRDEYLEFLKEQGEE